MHKTRPLKFSELSIGKHWQPKHTHAFKSKACQRAYNCYVSNLARAHQLTLIPGYSFWSGSDWCEALFEAMQKTGVADSNDSRVIKRASAKFFTRYKRVKVRDAAQKLHFAKSNVEIVLSRSAKMKDSLVGMLESLVVQTWTAYEVLAEQLMRGALKERPKLDLRDTPQWKGAKKAHSGFRSRSNIANYYRWVFETNSSEILAVVDSSAIHALGVLRNSLVHCGGTIDKQFKDDRKGFFKGVPPAKEHRATAPRIAIPELALVKGKELGYRIRFTGELVSAFIFPVVSLGFDLVKAVDKWLYTHK